MRKTVDRTAQMLYCVYRYKHIQSKERRWELGRTEVLIESFEEGHTSPCFCCPLSVGGGQNRSHRHPDGLVSDIGGDPRIPGQLDHRILILLFDRWNQWRRERKPSRAGASEERRQAETARPSPVGTVGLVGLALLSPLATGTHLAAAVAMAFRTPKGKVTLWMTVSIFLWTTLLAATGPITALNGRSLKELERRVMDMSQAFGLR